jgi:aminopeptidase N
MKGDSYEAVLKLTFELKSNDSELLLDYSGKGIASFMVNGVKIENLSHDGHFIHLDHASMSLGKNVILVHLKNQYASDGNGLHSFMDTDGK